MESCIFCKIAAGEIPSNTLYLDDDLRAILDVAPAAPGHALILPRKHFRDVTEMPGELLGKIMTLGGRIGQAQQKALSCEGFNLIQNNGEAAGQTVFHFHLHVIPRKKDDGALALWEPGESSAGEREEVLQKLLKEL